MAVAVRGDAERARTRAPLAASRSLGAPSLSLVIAHPLTRARRQTEFLATSPYL
jgi:hypothetical protein